MSAIASRRHVLHAAGWMVGALLSFTSMAVGVRELSADMTTFQLLFFRSVIGLVVVSLLLSRSGWGQVKSKQFGLQLFRNVVHFGGQYGWFVGIAFLPLTEVFAIEFTVPIWTMVLAIPVLGEKLTRVRALVALIGFSGVLIVLRPGAEIIDIAALAVVAAAICYAAAHVFTKRLADTDSNLAILFYMVAVQLPLGFIPSLENWYWPTLANWPWIIIVGLAGLSAHYCLTSAFRLADATVVVPMDFLRLPLIAAIGYFAYDEALDPFVLFGALLIMVGIYLNIRKG